MEDIQNRPHEFIQKIYHLTFLGTIRLIYQHHLGMHIFHLILHYLLEIPIYISASVGENVEFYLAFLKCCGTQFVLVCNFFLAFPVKLTKFVPIRFG